MPLFDVTVEGTTYEVNAPDENTAWRWANYTHRQQRAAKPAVKPESGFFPALRAGATELGGGISALLGKLGLKDEAAAQAEYDAAQQRAKEIFAPTQAGWTEAPGTKFLELLGGSVPYMAAPLAAGAAAATLPVTGPAALATTLGAAGLTSATQFTASFLSRQMEEGKKLAETDLGAAALAAIPAAALDTLSLRLIPGIGRIFGQAGIKVTAENAKEIAEQGLKKVLIDYTAATGKTMGAEGLTEAAQQVLERAQAGLSLTDPKARAEYFESFLGGAVLGGTLAVPGRYYERSKAQGEARTLLEGQEAEQRKAAREAAEAEKKTPDYLLKLDADYQTAVKRMQELQAAVKDKPGKDALPDERVEYQQRVEELKAFTNETMRPLTAEYTPRKAEIAQLKERRRVEGMTPEDYMLEQMGIKVPKTTAPATLEEAAAQRETAEPPVTPETSYAKEQLTFAQRQGLAQALNADEQRTLNIAFLMQDPAMAQRLVNSKTAIPDVSAKESNAILSSIKLKLQERYKQQAGELAAERPDLAPQVEDVDTFAPWKQAIEAEERLREEEAVTAAPVRKEEAVISPEREALIQERETARRRYFAAAATYEKARGTPDGVRALQQLLAARRQYEALFPASAVSQLPQPTLLPETEAQLNKALEATVGEAPSSAEELEARVQRMADTRKTAIAKVAENAAELDQYERLTRYMGTKQGLSEIARTPEMAEAAKRRMTPMLEQAQASRNEAIAAAIQEIKLQRDLSGLVPLSKTDAELQAEFRDKLNRDLQQAKGKDGYTEKRRQEAVAQQLQRINNRIQQLESGDRVGRLLGYASAFRGQQERTGELSNLYKAYKNLSMQQGLTPQAVQLNRTLQNLIDFYTVGGGAAKPRLVAKGPREVKRELVLGERAFTGYEPTIEGTEVRYDKPRKKAAFKATPEEQALVEDMRARELAALNEAADRQYTPETSDRAKKQILDELRARIDGFNAPATQEEVAAAQAQAAPQDQGTGDLFAAATERAQTEFQAAGERRTAARSEFGRAMAGMRGKSAIMDQAQRLAEAFGKDLGLRGTYAEAKEKLTKARAEKRAAETEFTEKEQEALRAAADDALIAQREAEAANRAANNTVDAVAARLEAERQTPTVEVRTPPRAMVLLQKIIDLKALIADGGANQTRAKQTQALTPFSPTRFVFRPGKSEGAEGETGLVKAALDQAVRAAKEGESWASDIEQVQAHMSTLEKYLSRREAQGRLSTEAELLAKQWYRKLADHEAALRRPMYGAGQLEPDEIRNYTQRRLSVAHAEYDRIKLQIDGLHRQLLDTEVSVAKREVDRINGDINKLIARTERREGADLANQELQALMAQHKDAVANLNAAQKTFDERKKAESVPFTRKSPASELEQWMKGAQERFEQSVQRFKDKQAALERQATAPAGTVATTATERRVEAAREAAAKTGEPRLEAQLEAALEAQRKLKRRGSKKQREAIAEKIADLRKRIGGESSYGEEYYETSAQQQAAEEAREKAALLEAREAGKEETTRAGRRKAAKEIFGVQRTIAETGEVPQAVRDGNKLDKILKSNRQAFEMAVEQGFKSTAIRPQKRGKSATPERVMRTPIEGIAYRLRQEIVEKMAAPQTKEEKKALTELRERLYGLEEAINTAPVTVEERRRTARAIWAKLPKDTRSSVVDTFNGRTESGGISVAFFDRFADALETTVIRQRLGQPLSQAPVTTMTKAELAPIQAETEKRVAATLKATEELRQKYYEQKEKELADKARLQGQIDEATQREIEKEAKEFADRVVQRFKEEEAREATRRMTEPMRSKPEVASEDFMPTPKPPSGPAFKTRILPDGTRKQVLRPAAAPEGLPRIEEERSDSDFYKVTGFQPDASAPFHKMTLAEAARFGASKARGQRKELFTRLADLFDEATTPEKQGLVLATNGKPSNASAYGAFYRKSNVVFSPGIKQTGYLETLLHELTHAASWYALSVDKRLAGRVESLRRKAEAWAETKEGKAYIRKHAMFLVAKDQQGNRGIYGLKNIDEFLSELYADREFQKFLTQIPSDAPKKNLLTRFVEFMSSFFSAPDQAQQSLFAEAVALSEEVLETTRREIYGTDIELSEVRRSRLPFGIEGPPDVAFSTKMPTAARVANQLVGKEKGVIDKIRDNFLGIGGRAQFIDKYFPTEEALKRAGADPTKAMQAMYYLRMHDQRMHFTSQAITDGVPERVEKTRRDGTKEFLIEAKPGANLQQAFDILKRKDVVKEAGSADAANKLVTLYMAAIRGERVGYDTLNFGRVWAQGEIKRIENELKSPKLSAEQRTVLTKRMNNLGQRLDSMPTPEDIKAAKAEIDANPVLRDAFSEVRDIYNQYNRDLINFNVQSGALSKEQANKLLQENDYIPYYRMRDGVAELIIGKETPIRIGNLKDSPHLQELVGGDEPIMDFIASSVQNTSMLINMATHNLAMRNLMFEFKDLGLATVGKVKGGNAPTGAVTFKLDGVEHFGVVDTEALGISSDLLVKGLAGIPTMFPAFVRVMGMPARFLRRMIVASPLYMARQLFRDSLAASIASGSNTVPILSALKQIGKAGALERRGITGGQVFTGMPEDQARMIKDMQAGKLSITNGLAYLEGKAAQVDALTRRAQYEDYLKQGLSEMEATYRALESMNFSRRGLSPSMHMASTLIPFFNAQIQGLDVLYRSFTGQMPMNERLEVRKKLITRGAMLALLSFAYAMAMQDDEAYKNAKPEEKYGNWFVSLPGVEQPIRLPIPFELGYIFKALPEAIVNTLSNEEGGEEALKALKHIVQQMIPGASSYFIPAGVKPLAEVGFGVSAYTGRDIESAREQDIEPGYRARESTTELAKTVGEMTGFSPIKLEFLISGYTGQMGMALISALSAPFAGTGEGPAPATKRPSDLPLVGTLFQPKDASGIIDLVYERMNKVRQVQETYKRMLTENKPEQAKRYAEEKADELSLASVAGAFREQMGQITEFEREVRASTLTPDRKRAELDRARQAKIRLAQAVQGLSGRTAPQAARP